MRPFPLRSVRFCASLVLAVACGTPALGAEDGPREFGAPLVLTEVTPLSEVLRDPEAHAGAPLLISGRVADVCQKKGCWTVLQDGEASVRVRFADYGFFLPTDCQGEQAWVEGNVVIRTLSEKEARHYEAESSNGDPDAIDGPQREVGFVAAGVRFDPPQ
jgi:hypothetical protein